MNDENKFLNLTGLHRYHEALKKVIDTTVEHTSDKSNPHAVTKAQVGLGNVPNVATNNQTPTYSQASTLANLTSGEKLSVSFGKIMKAIADFITHKNSTSNPHRVTKSQVGLGNVDNTSDANKPISTATQKAIDEKLDSNFLLNGFAGIGEVTEKLADCSRSATIVIGASDSRHASKYIHSVDYECSGTNDQTTIQQAIDALPSTGGKIVLLEGTYNISGTIDITKKNVTLQGLGRNVILKMATSTSNVNMFDISGATGLVISDIAIDYANNTGGGSIAIKLKSSAHVVIERVNITNSKGIGVEWYNCAFVRFSDISFINVRQCVSSLVGNHFSTFSNIVINTVTDGIVLDVSSTSNKILGCSVHTASGMGIASYAPYTTISDNIVYNCGVGITANGNCSTVSGNNVRDNNTGISVNGKMVNVSGNTALRADDSGNVSSYSSSQYTILMGSSSANCLVTGNLVKGKNYTNNGASTNTFANNKY